MRWICLLIACVLFATPALARSADLSRAIELYESGQLSQARDQLRLLVDKRHFSTADRIQARLYLASIELALQNPLAARDQLTILARRHPKVRPDPSVFAPELMVLAEQIRQEVAARPPPPSRDQDAKKAEAEHQAALAKQAEAEHQAALAKQAEAEHQAALAKQAEADHQAALAKQAEAKRQAELARKAEADRAQHAEARRSPPPNLAPTQTLTTGPLDTPPPPAEGHPGRRTWGYVAMGVGGAAAIVGGLCGMAAHSAADDVAKAQTGQEWEAAKQRVTTNAGKATGSFVLAGLALTGGAVMVATSF